QVDGAAGFARLLAKAREHCEKVALAVASGDELLEDRLDEKARRTDRKGLNQLLELARAQRLADELAKNWHGRLAVAERTVRLHLGNLDVMCLRGMTLRND